MFSFNPVFLVVFGCFCLSKYLCVKLFLEAIVIYEFFSHLFVCFSCFCLSRYLHIALFLFVCPNICMSSYGSEKYSDTSFLFVPVFATRIHSAYRFFCFVCFCLSKYLYMYICMYMISCISSFLFVSGFATRIHSAYLFFAFVCFCLSNFC